MDNFKYRKANIDDLNDMATLVSKNLGTCTIQKNNKQNLSFNEIVKINKDEITKDIQNYYVCVDNDKIIGVCGISDIKYNNIYHLELDKYREILYLVVDGDYQRKGIGTKLMHLCCDNVNEKILYEAWGDKDYVNSKTILERLNFTMLKDLGETYYKDNNYCPYCINRDKICNKCEAEVWIKA